MIVTLNSKNQFNYEWTNTFNETLTLKKNSVIKVKNINVSKKFSVVVDDTNRAFVFIFDGENNPPFTFTINSGRYTLGELEDVLNSVYDPDIYGYDINFVVETEDFIGKTGKVKININGYVNPTNQYPNPFVPIDYNTALEVVNDTQQVGSVLSKTSGSSSLEDNSFLYKGYVCPTQAPTGPTNAGFPPRPVSTVANPFMQGTIKFNSSFTGANHTDISFALVKHDWDGTFQSAKEILRVDVVGTRKLIRMYQAGNEIVDWTAETTSNRDISLSGNRFLVVRMYTPVPNMTPDQQNYYGHFSCWTESSGNKRDIRQYYSQAKWPLQYSLHPTDRFYPVWFFLDNTTRVNNVTANINTANQETRNVIQSKIDPEFEVNAQCIITLDGTNQIITASDPLPANNSSGANTQRTFDTGHVVFSMTNNSKTQSVGFGLTKSLLESDMTYGFRFNSDGSIYKIKEGVVDAVALTTYNTTNYYKLSMTTHNPILETSTDSGTTWTMLNVDTDLTTDTQGQGMYFNIVFESQLGSAGSVVKVYEEATLNQWNLGVVGQYIQFKPDTLKGTLGFTGDSYAIDFTNDPFPQTIKAENDMRFEESVAVPFKKSFRIQARNLPVKSYNGFTGASDFTIATLDIDRLGNVSYPLEQRTECLNKFDVPLNEIAIEITDEENTLATTDFGGDTQLTLEITPSLSS